MQLSNELVNLRSMKDHDYALLCREKDELAKNHHLVMSERDGVHKEIDMLNDRIAKADSKVNDYLQFQFYFIAYSCFVFRLL